MKKERDIFKLFNKTESGASKLALFIMGIILGLVSSTLFGYMCGNFNATGDYRYYDWLLFVVIFLLILTGELIGIYFGAYEEYRLNQKKSSEEKKNDIIKKEIKEETKPLVKDEPKTEKKTKTSSTKKIVKKTPETKKKVSTSSKNTGKKSTTKKKVNK